MKKFLALYFLLCSFFGLKAQDSVFYQKFFPDPLYPMPVPITKGDKSFNYYTQYKDVVQFIKNQAARFPDLIKIGSIGETQRGREQISVLLTNQKSTNTDKLRVTIIGCVHGNEPISTEGMMFLIYRLTQETQYAHLLDHLEILVLPDVNADGRESDKRTSSNGIDLNRDLTSLDAPESRNIKTAINKFDPQVVLDFHEF
ncbi:MAG TPA: M14 family zinc carboxypeptidase, partial [Puia sp.]|nr:M14 family zinc carboxypeptidase [Puia sp.]